MGRQRLKKKWKKLLPVVTVTLTGLPFAVWTPPATAFFPPVWPISPPVTVVPPTAPPPVVVAPPVSPPPMVVPPTSPPPIIVPPVAPPPIVVPPVAPPPPTGTPEPATLVSGLIGLAALAGYRLKRRHDPKDEPKE
jgi:hypothetical protein